MKFKEVLNEGKFSNPTISAIWDMAGNYVENRKEFNLYLDFEPILS